MYVKMVLQFIKCTRAGGVKMDSFLYYYGTLWQYLSSPFSKNGRLEADVVEIPVRKIKTCLSVKRSFRKIVVVFEEQQSN